MAARGLVRALLVPVLALASASCDAGTGATGPEEGARLAAAPSGFRIVRGQSGGGALSAVVTPTVGVILRLGDHRLLVYPGTVSQPTVFRMEAPDPDHLLVELTATSVGSTVENDVGAAGFRKPVELWLGYGSATEPVDPLDLAVGWVRPGGTVEAVGWEVDESAQEVGALLRHFSAYAVVTGAVDDTF